MTLSHAEIEELLGAYVCDAVDPDEVIAVERHLQTCPKCRAEVAQLREVTALLATADTPTPAPDGVWDRIISSLEEMPPPLRLSVVAPMPEAGARGSAPEPATAPVADVVPISQVRSLRRRILTVAAAVALVLGVVGFGIGRSTGGSSTQQASSLQEAASKAFVESGSKEATLVNDQQEKQAVAVVRPNGEGYLLGDDLPAIPDRIYQLWGATTDGTVVSLGVLPQPGVMAFSVGNPDDVSLLMVTEEQHPVGQPTGSPVAQGPLT